MNLCCFLVYSAPGDYESVQDVQLVFQIGHAIGLSASVCVDVDVYDDEIVEYVEVFTVSLASDDPVVIAPISEANVSIFDNDCKSPTASPRFPQSSRFMRKGGGAGAGMNVT